MLRRAIVRELSSTAYELGSGIVEGRLHHGENGRWMIGNVQLDEWLAKYGDQEIVVIVVSLEDDRPVSPRMCRTCGNEYVGAECPRCREVRSRLRGG